MGCHSLRQLLGRNITTNATPSIINPRRPKSCQFLPVLKFPLLVAVTRIVPENNECVSFGKRPSSAIPVEFNPDNVQSTKGNIKASANLLPLSILLGDDVPFTSFPKESDLLAIRSKVTVVLKVLDGVNSAADIPDDPLCNAELIRPSPKTTAPARTSCRMKLFDSLPMAEKRQT